MFYFLVSLLAASLLWWAADFYYSKTRAVPDFGGEYIEAVVGQPLHINPVISQSNNADEDLVQLIFNGLLKYDPKGKLINDLAESYEISDDRTLYTFHLKKNVRWQDGEPLKASDILFTVNILSDPAYKSPLRSSWQGIEAGAPDNETVTFRINTAYAGFLHNLTFGILPEHIWGDVPPEKFGLTNLNMEPVGTGPYKFNSLQKDSRGNIITYRLTANPDYFEGKPYISKITFNFYPDSDTALKAFNQKEVMGISSLASQKISGVKLQKSTSVHKFFLPRYFAVFFNQTKSVFLAEDKVREALAFATDRQEIISRVLGGNATPAYSPLFPGAPNQDESLNRREYDLERSMKIMEGDGWKRGEDGIFYKNEKALEINLTTTDWPELFQTAEILKDQWEKAGFRVNINSSSISDVQQNYIRPREYEALLFGQVLSGDPDLYSFWHSSQKRDPGLNLALFENSVSDKLIEEARTEFDLEKRASLYADLRKKIIEENPAVFLYSPDYVYPVNKKVRGIDMQSIVAPAKRFSDISHWYLKTKREWE